MSNSSNLIKLEKRTPQLWQVTFANPPFNLVVPEMVSALQSVARETALTRGFRTFVSRCTRHRRPANVLTADRASA